MQTESKTPQKNNLAFGKTNYKLLILSIFVVILGFVLMAGKTDIYSTVKITIAPVVVLIGFGLGVYAILKKS